MLDDVSHETSVQILANLEQFFLRALRYESIEVARRVTEQHAKVAHKLVDEPPTVNLKALSIG